MGNGGIEVNALIETINLNIGLGDGRKDMLGHFTGSMQMALVLTDVLVCFPLNSAVKWLAIQFVKSSPPK